MLLILRIYIFSDIFILYMYIIYIICILYIYIVFSGMLGVGMVVGECYF